MAMFDRPALKAKAKAALSGNWGQVILVSVVYILVLSAASSVCGVGGLVVGGAMEVGLAGYLLNLTRGSEKKFENLFDGFSLCFLNSLVANLLYGILVFLGFLVIVPGIIMALGWSQYAYIMREEPSLDGWECLKRSKALMKGHKGQFFVLQLSFFWWGLLTIITFGLASFYVYPYMKATMAEYYDYVKNSQASEGAGY